MANFGVYLDQKYDPPFEDWWAIKVINHDLLALSEELAGLPCELPAMLKSLTHCLDVAINTRRSYWGSGSSR
jgi:hypothetical protein